MISAEEGHFHQQVGAEVEEGQQVMALAGQEGAAERPMMVGEVEAEEERQKLQEHLQSVVGR